MNAKSKKHQDAWKKPAPRYPRGVLAEYAHTVTSASGVVTHAEFKVTEHRRPIAFVL